jgi:hypothetical protein
VKRIFDILKYAESRSSPAYAILQKELKSAGRLFEKLNPLEHIFFRATVLNSAWRASLETAHGFKDFGGLLVEVSSAKPVEFQGDRAIAYSVEDGGVLGAIRWMQEQPGLVAVFGNDLAYTRLGIDLVARHRGAERLLICEAKGSLSRCAAPGRYLRMTRRKGRQLSWRWCWESLVEFSRHGATALLFLECFRDVLLGRCERVLSVSHLRGKDRRYTLLRTHTF